MDPSRFLDTILDDASEVNNRDEDYQRRLVNWHRLCVTGLAGVSVACNAWILLCGASVALHSKQSGMSRSDRDNHRVAIVAQLQTNPLACKGMLRMTPEEFNSLCGILHQTALIRPSSETRVAKQLACFLFIIGQKFTNRAVAFMLCRSGQTISRFFHNVLRAVFSLEAEMLLQPKGLEVAPQIEQNPRYFPYFKDCVGAIDGTHVRVKGAKEDAARYRGRKDWPTQNVLAVCGFDMRFTYVLAGWEGSASDSRVFKSALKRDDALLIPQGKYLLADAGYGLSSKLITPYGRTRYHLKEYAVTGPQNMKELFNLRHASLGAFKKRFPILGSGAECQYSSLTMTKIVLAYCIMHTFLVGCDTSPNMCHDEDVEATIGRISDSLADHGEMLSPAQEYNCGVRIRDDIAMKMLEDYTRPILPKD